MRFLIFIFMMTLADTSLFAADTATENEDLRTQCYNATNIPCCSFFFASCCSGMTCLIDAYSASISTGECSLCHAQRAKYSGAASFSWLVAGCCCWYNKWNRLYGYGLNDEKEHQD